MNFFTQIEPTPSGIRLDTNARITALGSCFAQVIGQRLTYYKWPTWVNPLGVLFHPLALSDLIKRAMSLEYFQEKDLFQHQLRFYILALHGQYSDEHPQALLNRANADLKTLHLGLIQATHVMITLGTAWTYKLNEHEQWVGNCHKLPGSLFSKHLLSPNQIQTAVTQIVAVMAQHNPEAQLIFSVSPVRHIKDGMVENSLGKAHLISGLHAAIDASEKEQRTPKYFPAYELMMDQLRDYRFYQSDLIHPNDQGQQVVWEYFKQQWIEPSLESFLNEIHSVQQGLSHRPLRPDSAQHQEFIRQLKVRIQELERQFPHLKFD